MPIRPLQQTYIMTVTMPTAGLAANNQTAVQFQQNPQIAAVPSLTVPSDESWLLEDLYVSAAQTYDGLLTFYTNGIQVAYQSGNINGLLVSNPSRPQPSPFSFKANANITAVFTNLTTVPTSAAALVLTVFAQFRRFTPY